MVDIRFPNLSGRLIAIDTETHDPDLTTRGPGWPFKDGRLMWPELATKHADGKVEFRGEVIDV